LSGECHEGRWFVEQGKTKTGRKYRSDRTEGISDGVFAVSLTLLILDGDLLKAACPNSCSVSFRIARYLEPFTLAIAQLAYEGDEGPELAYRIERFGN